MRRMIATGAPVSDSDIAWFATVAVRTGRVWTLPDAVAAMQRLDPATEPPERVRAYVEMLYPHAWAGNALALDAVIDLNGEGRLFGALSDATLQRIVTAAQAAGDGRAYLRLALQLLHVDAPGEADKARARDYLTRAIVGDHLAVQVIARTLLEGLDPGSAQAPVPAVRPPADRAADPSADPPAGPSADLSAGPSSEAESELAVLE